MNVILEQGTLQGLHYKTHLSNKNYISFLGIPYAKPPINDLRFKVRDQLLYYYSVVVINYNYVKFIL